MRQEKNTTFAVSSKHKTYCLDCFKNMVGDIKLLKRLLKKYNHVIQFEDVGYHIQEYRKGEHKRSYFILRNNFKLIFGKQLMEEIEKVNGF